MLIFIFLLSIAAQCLSAPQVQIGAGAAGGAQPDAGAGPGGAPNAGANPGAAPSGGNDGSFPISVSGVGGASDSGFFCVCRPKPDSKDGSYSCKCNPSLAQSVNPGGANLGASGGNSEGSNAGGNNPANSNTGANQGGANNAGANPGGQGGNNGPAPTAAPANTVTPGRPAGVAADESFGNTWTWVMCTKQAGGWLGTGKPAWKWLYDENGKSVQINGKWLSVTCNYGTAGPFYVSPTTFAKATQSCKANGFELAQPADGLHSGWFPFQVNQDLTEYFRETHYWQFDRIKSSPVERC